MHFTEKISHIKEIQAQIKIPKRKYFLLLPVPLSRLQVQVFSSGYCYLNYCLTSFKTFFLFLQGRRTTFKITLVFLSFFLLTQTTALWAFTHSLQTPALPQEPASPQEPQAQTEEEKTNTQPTQNSTVPPQDNIMLTVVLGNGKKIRGQMQFPEQITFEHDKEGLRYKLTLPREEIEKIRILKYQKKILRQKKETIIYSFEPNRILITTKDERKFYINNIFNFLKKFIFVTKDGETVLFAYFADTWQSRQTKWLETQEKDFNAHDSTPHPLAVREWILP